MCVMFDVTSVSVYSVEPVLLCSHSFAACRSNLSKPLEMVFITVSFRNKLDVPVNSVFLRAHFTVLHSVYHKQARVHPGETPASFMCHGLIEFLLSNDPVQ